MDTVGFISSNAFVCAQTIVTLLFHLLVGAQMDAAVQKYVSGIAQKAEPNEGGEAPAKKKKDTTIMDHIVERIVGYNKDVDKYRVRWEGYGSDDDTWEPFKNLNEEAKVEAMEFKKKMEGNGSNAEVKRKSVSCQKWKRSSFFELNCMFIANDHLDWSISIEVALSNQEGDVCFDYSRALQFCTSKTSIFDLCPQKQCTKQKVIPFQYHY